MGNCQAAEAATVVIQHSGGRVQRLYKLVSAGELMAENPGHCVAAVAVVCVPDSREPKKRVTRVRLLKPQDMLQLGRIYRLVSTKEIMKELQTKYGKVIPIHLKFKSDGDHDPKHTTKPPKDSSHKKQETDEQTKRRSRSSRASTKPGNWRPSLQSISELGSPCRVEQHKRSSSAKVAAAALVSQTQ